MRRREKQTQYFLHSVCRSYIITWIHFCRKDYSKCLLNNVFSLLTLPSKLFSENTFFYFKIKEHISYHIRVVMEFF